LRKRKYLRGHHQKLIAARGEPAEPATIRAMAQVKLQRAKILERKIKQLQVSTGNIIPRKPMHRLINSIIK
jgi:hypothetical protein